MWDEDLGARRAVPLFPFTISTFLFLCLFFCLLPFSPLPTAPPVSFSALLMIDSEVVHRTTWVRRLLTRWDRVATYLPKANLCLFCAGDACRARRLSLAAWLGGLGAQTPERKAKKKRKTKRSPASFSVRPLVSPSFIR